MSLLDILRQEYVKGTVVDKYRLDNGNVGLIVEGGNKRYHVEFKDYNRGPCIENLFGLLKEPFSGKTKHVDKLIKEGDSVELTVSYSKGPLREAYRIHSVSGSKAPIGVPVKWPICLRGLLRLVVIETILNDSILLIARQTFFHYLFSIQKLFPAKDGFYGDTII